MKFVPLLAVALLAGCSTASRSVSTVGKAAVSATGTAVQLAKSGATGAGQIVRATTGAAVRVAQAPVVIFKDKLSGRTQQIPWQKGMTVASAGRLAKLATPITAFQVLRGQQILKGTQQLGLQPGDMIERLASTTGKGFL